VLPGGRKSATVPALQREDLPRATKLQWALTFADGLVRPLVFFDALT
jgi:hypothetical protein